MPELQQPDIVGNFLSSYATAQAQQQAQQDRQFNKQRIMKQDQYAEEDRAHQDAARKTDIVARAALALDTPEKWAAQAPAIMASIGATGPVPGFDQRGRIIAEAQSVSEQLKAKMDERKFALDERQTNAQIAAANRSNRGDGSSLANTVAQREQLAARYGLDPRTPAGQKFILTGTLPDDPAGKPLNDEQAKALGFAKRVGDANKVLEDPMYSKALLALNNNAGAMVPFAGNALVSSDYQMADQAVRDFINAQLRRESGAVISPSEFDNARSQYIPVYGDRPAVLERKRVARQRALENLFVSSGPRGAQQAQEVAPGAAPPPPAPGAGNIPPPPPGFVVK